MLSSWRLLLSALLVGAAMWISRAVAARTLDGIRVAYLPSAPELLGMVVLGGLGLTLLQAFVERGLGSTRPGAHLTDDAVRPLAGLLLLLLPYLPWLAYRAPLAGELTGPLAWWVWTGVGACTLWALGASLPRATRRWPSVISSISVAAAVAITLLAVRSQLSPGPIYPGGDEPHYLVVTQSVLNDGDLRIDDNHARGDYRVYFNAPLAPDHIVAADKNGAIYSIHPVGVSLLVAPGFLADGYRGASLTIALAATLAGLLLWHWLSASAPAGAAAFGWLAIVTSAPFVLHGFAIYPEIPAALAALVAIGWRRQSGSMAVLVARGVALGLLPWLGTKYAPIAVVIGVLVAWRLGGARGRLLALTAPAVAIGVAWLAWFWWIWGIPLPTVPYGTAHQMAISHLSAGLPGLLFDQEYGIVAAAPVLALAPIGWWRLWQQGGEGRTLVLETLLPFLALALTVGAYAMWWGGSAPPGRQMVAALPLLGVPLTALWRSSDTTTAGRALLVALLAIGVAETATLVMAQQGLLIANRRDGSAALLEYLSPSGSLVSLMPSFTANRASLGAPLARVIAWALVGGVLWKLTARVPALTPGRASLAALVAIVAVVVAASAVESRGGGRRTPPPEVHSPALDRFDGTARPVGIVFDPWRLVPPAAIPAMVRFEARPGLRVHRQPLPVLLNMRLALPAGTYVATIAPKPGMALSGAVGLQIGRTGPPQQIWDVSPSTSAPWSRQFTLDLDASFVGVRASDDFAARVGSIVVAPVDVVDAHKRLRRPPVVASAMLGGRAAYFHDTNVDLERDGFWTRGRVASELTLAVPADRESRGLPLRVHSGQGTTTVRITAGLWSTELALSPGQVMPIVIPALPSQRLLALTIEPRGGFVPAEHGGPSADRRLLGCWVEVVP